MNFENCLVSTLIPFSSFARLTITGGQPVKYIFVCDIHTPVYIHTRKRPHTYTYKDTINQFSTLLSLISQNGPSLQNNHNAK